MSQRLKILIIMVIVLMAVFAYSKAHNNKFFDVKSLGKQNVADDKISTLDDPNTDEYIPVDSSKNIEKEMSYDFQLGIPSVTPEVGFETGLPNYTKLTWQTNSLIEKRGRVSIDVMYPQFIGGKPVTQLNNYVSSIINDIIETDRKDLAKLIKDDPDTFLSVLDVASRYKVIDVYNGIVSIEMIVTDYTGGGMGNHSTPYTINWDLKNDRLIQNKEIFCSADYIKVLLPLVSKQAISNRKYVMYGNKPLTKEEQDAINQGVSIDEDSWDYFLLKKDGLIVMFAPYTITGGSAGIIKVFIPNSMIPNLICVSD